MPLDVTNLQNNKSEMISVGSVLGVRSLRDLHVRYWLFNESTDEAEKAAELVQNEEYVEIVNYGVEALCRTVCEWDLTYNGEVIALEPDVVRERVPTELQDLIARAIRKHRNPESRGKRK
jgi:hypothetical protein